MKAISSHIQEMVERRGVGVGHAVIGQVLGNNAACIGQPICAGFVRLALSIQITIFASRFFFFAALAPVDGRINNKAAVHKAKKMRSSVRTLYENMLNPQHERTASPSFRAAAQGPFRQHPHTGANALSARWRRSAAVSAGGIPQYT